MTSRLSKSSLVAALVCKALCLAASEVNLLVINSEYGALRVEVEPPPLTWTDNELTLVPGWAAGMFRSVRCSVTFSQLQQTETRRVKASEREVTDVVMN